jgi:DNA-binding transcriptional ArsR family regulator
MKKQPGMRVEPSRVRRADIVRRLKGIPHTIEEVARLLKVNYYTARRYLHVLYKLGGLKKMKEGTRPIRYYVPLRKDHE